MSKSLNDIRKEIDDIDDQIQQLLTRRSKIALKVGKIKQQETNPVYHRPEREQAILDRVTHNNTGPLDNKNLTDIFKHILAGSLDLQLAQAKKIACPFKHVMIIGPTNNCQ